MMLRICCSIRLESLKSNGPNLNFYFAQKTPSMYRLIDFRALCRGQIEKLRVPFCLQGLGESGKSFKFKIGVITKIFFFPKMYRRMDFILLSLLQIVKIFIAACLEFDSLSACQI